jgi:cold shock CspA family protein
MLIGLIKWFDTEKGFGTIGTYNEGDFFLHKNNFLDKPEKLLKGTPIIFEKLIDLKKKHNVAVKCKTVSTREDFFFILKFLTDKDNVSIEKDKIGSSKNGSAFLRKEIVQYSVKDNAVNQLFKNIDIATIQFYILDYFDKELDEENFIIFCSFIETRILENISLEIAEPLLSKIFKHFKENLSEKILFSVWKAKIFKYIDYTEMQDYIIPVEVLVKFSDEIDIDELNRIKHYDFGSDFCEDFAISRIEKSKKETILEIKKVQLLLPFILTNKKEVIAQQIKNFLTNAYRKEILDKVNSISEINTQEDLVKWKRFKNLIGIEVSEEIKNELAVEIDNIILTKCSENFKISLWLDGNIQSIPFDLINKEFMTCESKTKVSILKKITLLEQFELLKNYNLQNTFEQTFEIIGKYIKSENSLSYYFELKEKMFDSDFFKDKIGKELLNLFNKYVSNTANENEKYKLFFEGLTIDISLILVIKNVASLSTNQCEKLFKTFSSNQEFILEFLSIKAASSKQEDLKWIVTVAKEYLEYEKFKIFDSELFKILDPKVYFNLWEIGKVFIFPESYITNTLNEKQEDFDKLKKWITNGLVSKEKIESILFNYLKVNDEVLNRIIFYRQFNYLKCLIDLDSSAIIKIEEFKNDFYSIIIWFLDSGISFNFELLASKFIYFSPDDQVKIIRKLFFLKANGTIQLSISDLNKINRVDLDIYKINKRFNPEIPLDISTEIILNVLSNYSKTNKFLVEREILSLVLQSINTDKKRKFKITNYFESCGGRFNAVFDWSRNGMISKVNLGEGKFYYAIGFDYNLGLVEAVKNIPGRKWNNETKLWAVPSLYEKEVLEFAKKYRFFLDFDGSNYANNTHLAEFTRGEVPKGISFCEGRLAKNLDEIFKKEFWWCGNQKCFQKCETYHNIEQWESYTLLDFFEILKLNTDEINRMNDFVPKGHYYQFIGLINRFNRLLDKIYCNDCNEILYPVDTSHFAAHTVVRFCCENDNCIQHKKEVYLNHCLNGQCNTIVDSRVSKCCENGLYICENCGSCCSHSMLQRRLTNLQITGGFIHQNLIRCVNEKLGHLERAEYFCHKCNDKMKETSIDIFNCIKCNVKYDTIKYKIKRPHRHLTTI